MVWEKRADRLSILGVVFVAGYIAAMAANHVKDLWSDHGKLEVMQRKVVPALVARANCEKRRAETNERVAHEAILGATIDPDNIPTTDEIQSKECPKK